MNSLAHLEINVQDLARSRAFYEVVLGKLGWKVVETQESGKSVGFKGPDKTFFYLLQAEAGYLDNAYHRKNVGLNHIAFRVENEGKVKDFNNFLEESNIPRLYHSEPKDYSSEYVTKQYLAVFFEDPDRIKLEVVFVE